MCRLNPSTFRNTTDRNSLMKSCLYVYIYACSVPSWPDSVTSAEWTMATGKAQSFNDMRERVTEWGGGGGGGGGG